MQVAFNCLTISNIREGTAFGKGILMENADLLLPRLFKANSQKMISELRFVFKIDTEVAQDVVSDAFLAATVFWKKHGLPHNPTAWLYTVAKNKARNHLKKKAIFDRKLAPELKRAPSYEEIEVDVSRKVIEDSQLSMIFTICNPCIPGDAQIGLALNLLCGFDIQETADAFLTSKHVIYKRLERAKERLKISNVRIDQLTSAHIRERLDTVITVLYLLFSEGHFSMSQNRMLRESYCTEAMRLNFLLIENQLTNTPSVNALFALMCFHSSRFAARLKENDTIISYDDQDEALWDRELIAKGRCHLNIAATGNTVSRFHLEAGIAWWHTQKADSSKKWESILALYDKLLDLEYSPVAALNRAYAFAKVNGKVIDITEVEGLGLNGNLIYHSLLSLLHDGPDDKKSLAYSNDVTTVSNFNSLEEALV